jgi:FtsH-binding integral membrane protein
LSAGCWGTSTNSNAVTWLPWAALCLAAVRAPIGQPWPAWRTLLLAGAAFAVLTALMLLAGHTQSVFINLFGLGVWIVWPWGREGETGRQGDRETGRQGEGGALLHNSRFTIHNSTFHHLLVSLSPCLLVYFAGVAMGVLLAAPQLLPTLELSGLGLRSGGLSYAEASSFSLKPLALGWTLLPSYGLASLSTVFDTPGYTEFVAYIGVIGLTLAGIGAWRGRGQARAFGAALRGAGAVPGAGALEPALFPALPSRARL